MENAKWENGTLKDVVSGSRKITYGIVVPGPFEPNGNYMIRAQDYSKGWAKLDTIYRVGVKVDSSYKRSHVREGDILLTIVGSIGNTAKVPFELNGANLTQQTARLSFDKHCADFYHAVLQSNIGKKQIYRFAKSGVQPSLNLGDVEKFKVPIPPLPEQKKIAKILSAWDKTITTTEQLLANSQQQKKALMQQLLTGKKRLLDNKGVGFGDKWNRVKIQDIFTMISEQAGDRPYTTYSVTKDGLIDQAEYFKKSVASEDTSKYKVVRSGQFIMSGLNFWMGSVDVHTESEPVKVSPAYKVFEISKSAHPLFIKYFVRSDAFLCILEGSSITGASVVRRNFSASTFKNWVFALPTIEEQKKIAAVLDAADKGITILQEKLDALKQERKALMQQLLTGKRRVLVS